MSKSGATTFVIGWTLGVFLFTIGACSDSTSPQSLPSNLQNAPVNIRHSTSVESPEPAEVSEKTLITPDTLYEFRPLAEECCTQPGDASECWMADAERDGVLCESGNDCESDLCNAAEGRCVCATDDECNDGVCVDGLCGPSWCNGYLVCSCWGGCEWWSSNGEQTLHDLAAAQGMYCCEGLYAASPINVDPSQGGFYSQTPCGGCSADDDCDDNNPCTYDVCADDTCVRTNLTGTQDTVPAAVDCPFNDTLYASDCARASCTDGSCSIELNWKEGQVCSDTPGVVPSGAHTDCFSRSCAADGTCAVNISTGAACKVGENTCSNATCDATANCLDAPLDAAGLAANLECCDPGEAASFDDSQVCTDDFCCSPDSAEATCENIRPYTDRNVPNYDPASPGNCCLDSYNCDDDNSCTQNICCGSANAELAICGGDASSASWACVQSIVDEPGCCDAAPENLADNCDDIFSCTQNICCTPAMVAAAVDGDPCFNALDYNCSAALAFDVPPVGCCDPDEDAMDHCDDGNLCTIKYCDSLTHQCNTEPQPLIASCCGPNPGDGCGDADNNACTTEVCCDPITIANAVSGDPCFGAAEWNCGVEVSAVPGCCTDASDCDDGNPCTQDTCVANACVWNALDDLSAVSGVCCTLGGDNDSQCSDANDDGDCTQNVCCSPAMVAAAVAGDPCFEENDWSCQNPVETPLPSGCCTASTYGTDCNPDANPCVIEDCVNNNCTWTANDTFAFCCDADGDCPSPDATRPCLDSSSCDLADTPITNINWAQCDLTYSAAGTVCGAGGDCFDEVCDDPTNEDWTCSAVSYVAADIQPCAPPNAPPCGQYWCDGSGGCTDLKTSSNTYGNQTCDGTALGAGTSITQSNETNVCAPDNYEPTSSGIFSECGGETYSDVVYSFDDAVDDNYELNHRVVKVTDVDGDWDPIIYARNTCADGATQTRCNDNCTFNGSNYNTTDYGGFIAGECAANESTIITGPKAVTDVPNHQVPNPVAVGTQDFDQNGVRDGYDVSRNHNTTLIVDSRYTTPDNGGTFDVEVDEESHNNNDCRAIGSYSATPLIDGNFQWKQRWRGTTTLGDYNNYYGGGGPQMELNGAVSATDPHQAFFKLEIPSGSGKYISYVDWNALDKRGEDGHIIGMDSATNGGSFFHANLTEIFEDAGNATECSSSDMATSFYSSELPPQVVVDASNASYENAWLAVSNRTPAEYGDYELTLLKLQPDFFGFTAGYSAYGSGEGCGTYDYFDAEGYRLDFIPSGAAQNGYLMTVTNVGDGPDDCPDVTGSSDSGWDWGWLVHPRCYGPSGNNDAIEYNEWLNQSAHSEMKALPFKFPMGNEYYNYVYFDTSGRISLLKPLEQFDSCHNDGDCTGGVCDSPSRGCICATHVTDKKCFYDPGSIDVKPDVEKMFMPMSQGGYGPVVAGAWGSFKPKWKNGDYGYVTAQSVVFEGTTAYAISFVAMEIDTNAPKTSAFSDNWYWNRYIAHPSWQVILRIDGRMAFYYRPDVSDIPAWDETVDRGTFIVGMSGGSSTIDCGAQANKEDADAACVAAYGAETECDYSGPSGYTATGRCYRDVTPLVENSDGLGNE